jgi:hypothetical protein
MKDNKLKELVQNYTRETGGKPFSPYGITMGFGRWLASRPTCTNNERKFLDEVSGKGILKSSFEDKWIEFGSTIIYQGNFDSSLSELINKNRSSSAPNNNVYLVLIFSGGVALAYIVGKAFL